MQPVEGIVAPSLAAFTKSVRSKGTPVESSVESLISYGNDAWYQFPIALADKCSLFKRRQVRDSKACATATAFLLRQVVETFKATDATNLIQRVQQVGRRLIAAQPRELAIGNIVRRVLGVIREEAEEGRGADVGTEDRAPKGSTPRPTASSISSFRDINSIPATNGGAEQLRGEMKQGAEHSSLLASHTPNTVIAAPTTTSMFNLLSGPVVNADLSLSTTGSGSPGSPAPLSNQTASKVPSAKDLKAEVIEGIQEILDELNQADDQIAGYALDHIHSNETILTHSSSATIQMFLLRAAAKRKFTLIYAESYPHNHEATHASAIGTGKGGSDHDSGPGVFTKTLTTAGITVILVPDSAVFALIARVSKVLLSATAVLQNGDLVAAAGAKAIAKAAKMHSTHVVVLSAVYKLSPIYPFDPDELMENGSPGQVNAYAQGDFMDKIDIENPLFDYVPAKLIDLYITNL